MALKQLNISGWNEGTSPDIINLALRGRQWSASRSLLFVSSNIVSSFYKETKINLFLIEKVLLRSHYIN